MSNENVSSLNLRRLKTWDLKPQIPAPFLLITHYSSLITDFTDMRFRILLIVGVLATGLALVNLSCRAGTAGNPSPNQPPSASSQTPPTKRFTPADLAKLRWIEGSWRGTGDVEKPFFERYHFENESTLVTESFADESFSKITEVTRYELKNGVFWQWR